MSDINSVTMTGTLMFPAKSSDNYATNKLRCVKAFRDARGEEKEATTAIRLVAYRDQIEALASLAEGTPVMIQGELASKWDEEKKLESVSVTVRAIRAIGKASAARATRGDESATKGRDSRGGSSRPDSYDRGKPRRGSDDGEDIPF